MCLGNLRNGIFVILLVVGGCTKEPDFAFNNPHDPASPNYVPPAPDLRVTSVSGPSSATRGQTISVSATVTNSGNATAGSSTLEWYFSSDNVITTGDYSAGTSSVTAISAGGSQTINTTITVATSATEGNTYYLGAIADRNNVLTESNETNNVGVATSPTAIIVFISFSSTTDLDRFTLSTGYGTYAITAGALRMTATGDQYIAIGELRSFTFTNGTIEVQTNWVSGTETGHAYGLIFRKTGGNFYGFATSASGSYIVGEWTNSAAGTLKDWTYSSAIVQRGRNSLRVTCQGSVLSFYINGTYVAQVTDGTNASGGIALSNSGNGNVVDFDDVKITPAP